MNKDPTIQISGGIPGGGNSICKGFEVGTHLEQYRSMGLKYINKERNGGKWGQRSKGIGGIRPCRLCGTTV